MYPRQHRRLVLRCLSGRRAADNVLISWVAARLVLFWRLPVTHRECRKNIRQTSSLRIGRVQRPRDKMRIRLRLKPLVPFVRPGPTTTAAVRSSPVRRHKPDNVPTLASHRSALPVKAGRPHPAAKRSTLNRRTPSAWRARPATPRDPVLPVAPSRANARSPRPDPFPPPSDRPNPAAHGRHGGTGISPDRLRPAPRLQRRVAA